MKSEFKATHVIKYPDETVEVQSTGKGRAVDVAGFEHSLFFPTATVTRIEPRESAEPPATVAKSTGAGVPIGLNDRHGNPIPVVSVWVEIGLIRRLLEVCEMAINRGILPMDAVKACRDELRKAIGWMDL